MSVSLQSENNHYQLPLVQGLQGKYYVVDGQKYDEHFPKEWALNHMACEEYPRERSGPKNCANCRSYGSINGVFVFYCGNCTKYTYKGTRGGHIISSLDTTEGELWREFPYMNCVEFDEIGDIKVPTHRSTILDLDDKEWNVCVRKLVKKQKKKN